MNKKLFFSSALVLFGFAAQAATFQWQPNVVQPNPTMDVTQSYQFTAVSLYAPGIDGVTISDVMPTWTDEDGNVVTATSGQQNPWGWDATQFDYKFNIADFKVNGEYLLTFPEGMLTNAAGDLSAKVEIPYTFNVPDLAGAMFDDFTVLSISPDLNTPQAIWNDQNITISTNHNDAIGMVMLTITDTADNEVVCVSSNYSTGRVPGSNSDISWNVAGVKKFYEGHHYIAEFIFYNGKDLHGEMGELTPVVDKVYYEFEGRVEGYKYSDVQLLSVSPEPMSMISTPDQAVITYVFSAPVTVYQAETPLGSSGKQIYAQSYISSNEDKTVWTLNLSSSPFMNNVDSSVVINIYARDMDGYQLKGNEGSESESCFQYSWECELGAFRIETVTPAADETIDVLNKVVVKAVDGKQIAWSWNGKASVWSLNREFIGTLVYDNSEADNHATKEITFTKWKNENGVTEPISLTQAGTYAIVFDHGCFIVGEQYDSKISHSLTSSFSVSGEGDDPGTDPSEQEVFYYNKITPEPGSKVPSIGQITLWYPEMVGTYKYDAYVYENNGAEELSNPIASASVAYDWDDIYRIDVTFSQPVTAPGDYLVVVPAGTIGTDEYCNSDGSKGICNPELRLAYTVVDQGGGVDGISAGTDHNVVDMLGRIILRNASKDQIDTLPKGIYIIDGRKTVVR